jgi:hypothetical protein
VDVDPDRDDAHEDEERDHEDDGDEPGQALGHAVILPNFLPRGRMGRLLGSDPSAGDMGTCDQAMTGSDPVQDGADRAIAGVRPRR